MRGVPAWRHHQKPHQIGAKHVTLSLCTHPSSVSALRADPPSPTRGEGRSAAPGPAHRAGLSSVQIQPAKVATRKG
ncbi:hypothetical protein FJW08_28480 [Mesorhizobium sp. B3-2-1]|nr:hypothetical protein FJW08_28480 [Mesorhizobium sp. B3-2-1]